MIPHSLRNQIQSIWPAAAIALLLGLALLSLATLRLYPPLTCDESLYSSAAVSLNDKGSIIPAIYPLGYPFPDLLGVLQFGRSYAWGLAGMFRLFGQSWYSARLFSWIGWLLASGLAYLVGARCYGPRAGAVAALLFATSIAAFRTAHLARPESWTTATILLATLSAVGLLQSKGRPRLLAVLTGVLCVWPADFHVNGFAFMTGIGVALGVELGLRQRRWWSLSGVGLGMLMGLGLWFTLHYSNTTASPQNFPQLVGTNRTSWLSHFASFPAWVYTVFWLGGGPLTLLEGALGFIGLGLAVRRRSPADNTLGLVAATALFAFGVITGLRWLQYGVLWSPFWFLLGTAALLHTAGRLALRWPAREKLIRAGLVLLITGLISSQAAGDLWLAYQNRQANFEALGETLGRVIPPGSRVLGDPIWWWALQPDRTFMSDEYLPIATITRSPDVQKFLGLSQPVSQAEAVAVTLKKLAPDYVVLDQGLGCNSDGDTIWTLEAAQVAERCRLVAQYPGIWVNDPSRKGSQLGQITSVYACPG